MATMMDLERIGELQNHPATMEDGELSVLLDMACDSLLLLTDQQEANDTLGLQLEKAQTEKVDVTNKLIVQQAHLRETQRDMAVAENYIDALRRRIRDATISASLNRESHDHFVTGVQNCIDHKPPPEQVATHPAILRLQEALDAETAKAPAAE